MRVHLIGGGGSGKSFIAHHLAARSGIPTLDLDEIFWDREAADTPASAETRDTALKAFVQRDGWIIEGVYYRWVGPSFERADSIIVLTTPLWLRQVRLVRRFLRRKLGLGQGRRETVFGFLRFLAWNRRYDEDNLARALVMMDAQSLRYTKCRDFAEVMRHLEDRQS